jgi:homogentisate phytyltransferase / homogentisate geranylgeranyltransferase
VATHSSGNLSVKQARWIIILCGIIALVSAALTNHVLLILIGVIMLVGTAYSMPPLKFKRHHLAAAASILFVRGVLVNVGMPVHFLYAFSGKLEIPPDVWPLTFFVVGFSLAIAWFKDIPDTGGDKAFKINTLALSLSPRAAFGYGVAVVSVSYIGLLVLAAFLHLRVNQLFFFTSHAVLLLLFLAGASRVQLTRSQKTKNLLPRFLGLLFCRIYGIQFIVFSALNPFTGNDPVAAEVLVQAWVKIPQYPWPSCRVVIFVQQPYRRQARAGKPPSGRQTWVPCPVPKVLL